MWTLETFEGKKTWYEGELIERLKSECKEHIEFCEECEGDERIDCIDCTEGGKALMAIGVLDIIQEYEKEGK